MGVDHLGKDMRKVKENEGEEKDKEIRGKTCFGRQQQNNV